MDEEYRASVRQHLAEVLNSLDDAWSDSQDDEFDNRMANALSALEEVFEYVGGKLRTEEDTIIAYGRTGVELQRLACCCSTVGGCDGQASTKADNRRERTKCLNPRVH